VTWQPAAGAWLGGELQAPSLWRVPLNQEMIEVLLIATEDEVLPDADRMLAAAVSEPLARIAATVREHLAARGFVLLTGFPVSEVPLHQVKAAYAVLGLCLGWPVSQDRSGTLIAYVENAGADISRNDQRGHRSAAELAFHADRSDLVALLCVRQAESGGVSRLASLAAVHNILVEERPDLVEELYNPFPHDRRGEQAVGDAPWCAMPVFARVDGRLVGRYIRRFVTASQRWEDAPRLTPRQLEALDAVDEILERPGLALTMKFEPGDVQLIDNIRLLHARTAFADGPSSQRRRLLLRLWLAHAKSPRLPLEYSALYGSIEAGAYRGGVWPDGAEPPCLGAPVKGFPPPNLVSSLFTGSVSRMPMLR